MIPFPEWRGHDVDGIIGLMNKQDEAQIWEERVYAGGSRLVRGPAIVRWTTKAYFIRRFLQLESTDRLLDVGCGTGEFSMLAARQVREAVGVDAATTAIALAQAAAARLALRNARFIEGSAYDLRELLRDRALFDKAICFDLLEHLTAPADVLAAIFDLLRPGGRALIYTNCYGRFSWPYLRERCRGPVGPLWSSDRRDHHFIRFTTAQLRDLTEQWRTRMIWKNHFLVPFVSALSGMIDRTWRATRSAPPPSDEKPHANPPVQVQTAMRGPRLLVQAAKLAASVLEMETLGRFTPGAGVYLLLEKPHMKDRK